METEEKKRQGIQSVENAFIILDVIKNSTAPLNISDISEATQMSKSRVQKYIISFLRQGVVTRDGNSLCYTLGPKIMELGIKSINNFDVVSSADIYLRKIRENLNLTSTLNIWTADGPMVVRYEPSGLPVNVNIQLGYRPPLLKSATGMCFAAYKDTEAVQAIIEAELIKYNLDKEDVNLKLQTIRNLGYASRDKIVEGLPGNLIIACPVFDYENKIIAVMCILGFSGDFNTDQSSSVVKELQSLSHKLSKGIIP